jgi:HAD superfamily hydrolase (TIGR01509 family)
MQKVTVVIFDCDGVMFDSRPSNIAFYNHLLARFGLPPMSEDETDVVHMATAEESIRHVFEGSPYLEEALEYRLNMDYGPFIRAMRMEPGLKPLLQRLKTGFGLAVATNRSNTIGDVLSWHGLTTYFDIVVSSLDVQRPKPDPESLIKILEFFAIKASEAVYVGDSLVDCKTARNAGVPFISYQNRGLEAAYHVNDLEEVARIVGADPS